MFQKVTISSLLLLDTDYTFITFSRSSKFFTHILKNLKSDPNSIDKIALLIYIQAVATWLSMPIKDAKKRGIGVCLASQEINSYIIDTYSVQSNHGRYI